MALLALVLAAGLAAAPIQDVNEPDLRCAALIAMTIGEAGDKADPGLSAGLLYFIGRIEGRTPAYDLEVNLRRLLRSPRSGLDADRARCGGALQERGKFLIQLGEKFQSGE